MSVVELAVGNHTNGTSTLYYGHPLLLQKGDNMTTSSLLTFPVSERMKQRPCTVCPHSTYRTMKFTVDVPEFTPQRVLELVGQDLITDLGYAVELDVESTEKGATLLAFVHYGKSLTVKHVHELSSHVAKTLDNALKSKLSTQ